MKDEPYYLATRSTETAASVLYTLDSGEYFENGLQFGMSNDRPTVYATVLASAGVREIRAIDAIYGTSVTILGGEDYNVYAPAVVPAPR